MKDMLNELDKKNRRFLETDRFVVEIGSIVGGIETDRLATEIGSIVGVFGNCAEREDEIVRKTQQKRAVLDDNNLRLLLLTRSVNVGSAVFWCGTEYYGMENKEDRSETEVKK